MYKNLLAILIIITGTLGAHAQVKHVPLLMEFTQASCGPCAAQNPALNKLILANGNDIVSIKIQTSWPGYDPMYEQNKSESIFWTRYYGVDGVPKMHLDGTFWPAGRAYQGAPANLSQRTIDQYTSKMSPISVNVSHDIDSDFQSVDVSVEIGNETQDSFGNSNTYLYVAIIEKEIRWPYPAGTNGETEFYSVMHKMIPSVNGTKVTRLASSAQKTYKMSMDLPDYIYDVGQVAIVAWVEDKSTKEIIQSGESSPLDASTYNLPELAIEADKIETSGYCDHEYTPTLTLYNNGPQNLKGVVVGYSLDNGGNFITKTIDDVLEGGQSMPIEFDPVTLPAGHVSIIYSSSLGSNSTYTRERNSLNNSYLTPEIVLFEEEAFAEEAEFDFEGLDFLEIPQHIITEYISPLSIASVEAANLSATERVGGYGASDRTLIYYFRPLPAGYGAFMTIQKLDFSRVVQAELSFDWTMGGVDNNTCVLQIMGSTDCGETWSQIWRETGNELRTKRVTTSDFYVPSKDDWTTKRVSLNDYAGESEVLLRFVMISGGDGASIGYMDNVKVQRTQTLTTEGAQEENILTLDLYPNPVSDYLNVDFTLSHISDIELTLYNSEGKSMSKSVRHTGISTGTHHIVWPVHTLSPGCYTLQLVSEEGVKFGKFVVSD